MVDRREFLKGVAAVVASCPGIHHLARDPIGGKNITASEILELQLVAEGKFQEIILKMDADVQKIMWPAGVVWPEGHEILPSKGIDVFSLWTQDGGENWFGNASLDMQ